MISLYLFPRQHHLSCVDIDATPGTTLTLGSFRLLPDDDIGAISTQFAIVSGVRFKVTINRRGCSQGECDDNVVRGDEDEALIIRREE